MAKIAKEKLSPGFKRNLISNDFSAAEIAMSNSWLLLRTKCAKHVAEERRHIKAIVYTFIPPENNTTCMHCDADVKEISFYFVTEKNFFRTQTSCELPWRFLP